MKFISKISKKKYKNDIKNKKKENSTKSIKKSKKEKKKEKKLKKIQKQISNKIDEIINNENNDNNINNNTVNHRHTINEIIPDVNITNKSVYYTPSQIQTAYNIPKTSQSSNNPNVTIVIAYHYANLQSDFDKFCTQFNLPGQTLNIITLGTQTNSGWATEECLDVQMVHTANPYAQITVVEAKSSSYTDLFSAVNYANNLPGTQIISMSWGSREFNGQNTYDSYFSNKKICYCASSGDSNYVNYPSSSPNVIAVGGTTLTLNNNDTRLSETTWTSAGSGVSQYTPKPSYQVGKGISGNKRITPDISCVANPNSGVVICYSGNFYIIGGTSVSCPLFAGMLSITNQQRIASSKSVLTSVASSSNNLTQNYMYKTIYPNSQLYTSNIYDVTNGKDGIYNAVSGYDDATGLGAPICSGLLTILVNA